MLLEHKPILHKTLQYKIFKTLIRHKETVLTSEVVSYPTVLHDTENIELLM